VITSRPSELGQDVVEVALDGRLGQDQRRGDLGVRARVGDQVQNFELARAELGELGWTSDLAWGSLDETVERAACDLRGEQRVTRHHGADALDELLAEAYTDDERLLATIEHHDRPYNIWRKEQRKGRTDDHAVNQMIDGIPISICSCASSSWTGRARGRTTSRSAG
jgi:hypothetical protein